MRNRKIGALPVVKDEKLIGMITERDFFKILE
jgi:CBS domain-containing protein